MSHAAAGQLDGICHCKHAVAHRDDPMVSHLTAHGGVKRGDVSDHSTGVAVCQHIHQRVLFPVGGGFFHQHQNGALIL